MADGSPRMDPVEARVVGSLAEKELTTPQQYPLSLNALVLACNQTSNRDPVVDYDESLVEVALSSLKAGGWVRFVHPSHGRSVLRYRHVLDEKLGLDERRLALMAALLLRGPQTSGELRARTERMAQFESIASVESDLERLAAELEPLVVRLPRRPGQKEERWAHLLSGEPVVEPAPAVTRDGPSGSSASLAPSAPSASSASSASLAELRADVAALRAEVDTLRGELAELRSVLE